MLMRNPHKQLKMIKDACFLFQLFAIFTSRLILHASSTLLHVLGSSFHLKLIRSQHPSFHFMLKSCLKFHPFNCCKKYGEVRLDENKIDNYNQLTS